MDESHRHSGSGEETSSSPSSRPPPKFSPPQHTQKPSAAPSRSMPVREDCWSKEATHTLVEAWGEKHLELNKGNLRQKHWREVADAVNAVHGHLRRNRRTDVQCKNRIDTIKKKYKIEKARAVESPGAYVSPWPFFVELDALIGDTAARKPAPTPQSGHRNRKNVESSAAPLSTPATPALALTWPVPVGPRTVKPKRRGPPAMDDSFFRRTFTAAAAAEAPASSSEDERRPSEEEEEEEISISRSGGLGDAKRRQKGKGKRSSRGGCKQLAEAILKFGEIYERVETMKQEQLVQLEKHRMEFAKELEIQRMKLLMDTQLQLAKIKRLKLSSNDDADSC